MAISATPKIKYLTNKDLLEGIHVSKTSYCSFIDPTHAKYDFIVNDINLITLERIDEARRKRVVDLQTQHKKSQISLGVKNPILSSLSIDDIPTESIVIRLMTHDHIPINPDKIGKAKTLNDKHIRVNFPPFQHFIMKDDQLTCVLKSHWLGGLENGHFSKDHGRMTNSLATMFIKLVDRYGHRGNWRGYCIDEKTEALTKRGWLNIDDINENDIVLSYDNNDLKWSKINSIYRDEYNGLMHQLTNSGIDALVTPNHKLITGRGLIKIELLKETDIVMLLGQPEKNSNQIYQNELVELLGWILTEGCFERNERMEIKRITIYQNNGLKADRIRNCLINLQIKFSENNSKKNICFAVSRHNSREIEKIIPTKNLTMNLITSLTTEQRELLIDTMIDGDGWKTNNHRRYCQKNKEHIDLFRILCVLSGIRTSVNYREHISYGKQTYSYGINLFSKKAYNTKVECIDFHGGKRNGRDKILGKGKENHPNEPTLQYNGKIWCLETEFGSFVVRRNEKIYLTGNSYLDEMKCQALLQLSQVGLQFDESRSETPNPFAYYTQTLTNSFMRILNIEKKNQAIRDDMLIMHNVSPSNTRQVEDQIAQRSEHS